MRAKRFAVMFLYVLSVWPSCSFAVKMPNFAWQHWDVNDGLPVNSINAIKQGPDDYLWLATDDGLVSFDGVRFEVYTSDRYPLLPDNRIRTIAFEGDTLWMITSQHQLVSFNNKQFNGQALGAGANDVFTIGDGPNGTLWVGGARGLGQINAGVLSWLDDKAGAVLSIWPEGDSDVLVSTHAHGIWRFDATGFHPLSLDWNGGKTRYVMRDGQGDIWFRSEHGIHQLKADGAILDWTADREVDATSLRNQVYPSLNGRIEPFGDPSLAQFYLPLAAYDVQGNAWAHVGPILYRNGQKVFAAKSRIHDFLIDHEGSVWVATQSGLYQVRQTPITMLKTQLSPDDNIYGMYEDVDDSVWLGTLTAGAIHFSDDQLVRAVGQTEGLPGRHVWSMVRDAQGELWIGGYGLCRMKLGRCEEQGVPPELKGVQVHALFVDSSGVLWAGSARGLFCRNKGSWYQIYPNDDTYARPIIVLHEAADGALWAGTDGDGVLEIRGDNIRQWTTADGLSSNRVRSIFEDEDGALWLGTADRGLSYLRSGASETMVSTIRQSDGLFDNVIHQILPDDQGRLWMSTNRGIFWVEKAVLDGFVAGELQKIWTVSYDDADGMAGREANGGVQGAGIVLSDGRLWFGTQVGVAVVNPQWATRNVRQPKVKVESVWVGSEALDLTDEGVALNPSQRSFEIRFTAPGFVKPDRLSFRYKLEGAESGWQTVGNRRSAFYSHVPPGNYVLRVSAQNAHGVWSDRDALFAVSVLPLYYERLSFKIAIVCLLLAIITVAMWRVLATKNAHQIKLKALVEQRTKALEEEKLRVQSALDLASQRANDLEKMHQEKARLFAHVSHDLRTPLTLMVSPLKDVIGGRYGKLTSRVEKPLAQILNCTEKLHHLVDDILALITLQGGRVKLKLQEHDVSAFVDELLAMFSSSAQGSSILLTGEVGPLSGGWVFDRHQLMRVLDNIVFNAIKFTPAQGRILLKVEQKGEHLHIGVTDSGCGITAQDKKHIYEPFYSGSQLSGDGTGGSGLGLACASLIVQLHGGTIDVASEPDQGCSFDIVLPRLTQSVIEPEAQCENNYQRRVCTGQALRRLEVTQPSESKRVRPQVLVVDDSQEIGAFMRNCLEPSVNVIYADDAVKAFKWVRRSVPDLVISDIVMGDMDGFGLVSTLKKYPETANVPVIILSGKAEPEFKIESFNLGAVGYITKPFDPNVLRAQIMSVIAGQRDIENNQHVVDAQAKPLNGLRRKPLESRFKMMVLQHLNDPEFSVERLAQLLGVSRTQLYRRIKKAFGKSPQQMITQTRLEQAAKSLAKKEMTISETALSVGFKSFGHFSRSFRSHFNESPSQCIARHSSDKRA